jgi:hypothetical protein
MNYFRNKKVKRTTYFFQIMGIYVVLHSRNISNNYSTTLNETASGGNPDVRFSVALYTLKI